MNPPNREVALFSAALELPAGQRVAYLQEACADDPALRLRLEALLRVHEEALPFLESPALEARESRPEAGVPGASECRSNSGAEKPGDRIGRYKLLQQIGEGGCGVVYMAEQEEPVRRRVALKVIKLGMDTKQVIARFEAERQALALMDHPNIAKVLDAGATETGRPYFVMELVRGIKVTDYCDQNQLSPQERLKLFTQICQAIQHAHQKGIIHRDIKPSNILVTINEPGAPGCPKIIDFGIAKATTGQLLTDKTIFTAFEQFIGTPAYMSPEQAMMTSLDIDTRTDIYSLGVLLYELLTGKTPLDQKGLLAVGLEEMRRTIREREPARPSTCLSTMLEGDLTTAANHRHTEALKLIHLVRGDLDWIVMKALEKERARRYETANGLAMDIQRYLSCEPVLARPPSRLYEFQKTVRRHKFGFAAAAALITALAIGALVSTLEAIRATRAEHEQRTEAAKATAISDFLQQLLGSANPGGLKGSAYTVRQLLDDFSAGLGKQLAGQPEVEAKLRSTIGNAYLWLAASDQAQPHLERALALRSQLYGAQSPEVAQSLVDLAWNLSEQGRRPEAEVEARLALDIYHRRGTGAQPVMHALNALAVILSLEERFDEVEAVSGEAFAIARNSPQQDFPEMANILHNLADTKVRQAKYVEAERFARQAVAMGRRLVGPEHPETAWSLLMLGRALAGQQKLAEAERAYREALAVFRKYFSFEHKTVLLVVRELNAVLYAKGDSAAVEAMHREVLAGQRATLGNNGPAVAGTLGNLAASLYAQGNQAEAEKALSEAREVILKVRDQDYDKLPPGVRRLAELLKSHGRSQDVETLFEAAITLTRLKLGETNLILGELLHDYGAFLGGEHKLEAAAECLIKALPICRTHPDDTLAWTLHDLGEVVAFRNPQAAEPYYREARDLYRKLHPQPDSRTAWMCLTLGEVLYQQHKLPQADQVYRDALAIYTKCQPSGNADCARTVRSLLGVLKEENKLADGEALCREILAQQRGAFTNDNLAVAEALRNLAASLYMQGEQTQAQKVSREAVEIVLKLPDQDRAQLPSGVRQLAELLRSQGKSQDAERFFEDSIDLARQKLGETNLIQGELLHGYGEFLNGLAWPLATDPDPKLRDGPNAVILAEKAVAGTNRKNPGIMDTLAAAYAEAGQFTNAVRVQLEAIALLRNEQEKEDYVSRLKLYKNNSPYRDHGLRPN